MKHFTNPYNICTVQAESECSRNCFLASHLKCRFKYSDLLHFLSLFLTPAIPAAIGMIAGGFGWYLLGWLVFMLLFFTLWESRILCSHCPYYAENSRILHCPGNYGSLKIWKYHPEPMTVFEKIQLIIGFIILLGYPLPFLIIKGQFIFTFLTAWGIFIWAFSMQKSICSECVNFSCPLNRVPQHIINAYLKKNKIMREAWKTESSESNT